MSKSFLSSLLVAALAAGAMVLVELSPVSAFTLYGTSAQPFTSGQFDKGGAAAVGAAAVGAAVASPHCWINSYGYRVCN